MKILFYRYGSICEPDIITGFLELGNTVDEITVEIHNKNFSPADGIQLLNKTLLSTTYDFVFSINFYPFISEVCNIFQIRYICWTVDSPVMELYSSSIRNPWNRIFLFDKAQYDEFAPLNPSCIFHLPLASNPNRWKSVIQNASPELHRKFSSDISFVGSLYTEKCPYDRLQNAPAYLSGYLDGIMAAQQKVYGYNFIENVLPDELVTEFREHFPNFYTPPETAIRNDKAIMAQLYVDVKISAMERVRMMTILGEKYSVDLYTGSDTTKIPVNNRGFAKTLTEMPLIFHNSKINLNITSKAIRSGLPLRIFDILACGGFLITNYQTELADFFDINSDLVCYDSEEDLLEKTEYFLNHENERKEIAHNGLSTLIKYHNYPERLLQLLSLAYNLNV